MHTGGMNKNVKDSSPSKREAIRDAAVKVFAAKGYHTATVSEVAEVANVGKGTVYFYYASKEDLLLEILVYHFDQMMSVIERIEQVELAPEQAVQVVIADSIRRLKENPDLFKIMEQQPLLYHDRVKERFEILFGQMVDRTAGLLAAGMAQGFIRSCDTRAVASVLLSTAISFPLYLTLYPDKDKDETLDHLGQELATLLWASLRKSDS